MKVLRVVVVGGPFEGQLDHEGLLATWLNKDGLPDGREGTLSKDIDEPEFIPAGGKA